MASIFYEEELAELDVSDEAIRACGDPDTLLGWLEDADAAIADIQGQLEAASMGGHAEPAWVYRASKAMGYQGRAKARIKARLGVIGWVGPEVNSKVAELYRQLAEAKARAEVAVEFMRICNDANTFPKDTFYALEARAIAAVDHRHAKRLKDAA